jgi:hypothetical protein
MTSELTAALYRFELGLPARDSDIMAIVEALPELLDRGWAPGSAQAPWPGFHVLLASRALRMGLGEWVEALRRWTSTREPKLPERLGQSVAACPLRQPGCPLHKDVGTAAGPPELPSEPQQQDPDPTHDDAEPLEQVFRFLKVGGGPAGPAGNRFLDLIRKSTKGCKGKAVRQLIVTDPYLDKSFDETGADGDGFGWFQRLLGDGLAIDREHAFDLFLNPTMGNSLEPLRRRIVGDYPNARIKPFSVQGGRVHDRFYLVRGASDDLKGVFGPSLNSLSGAGIFLMGDLDSEVLQRLNDSIRCR